MDMPIKTRVWIETPMCKGYTLCSKCRNRLDLTFRKSLLTQFTIPNDNINFECPYGRPWNLNPDPAIFVADTVPNGNSIPCPTCKKGNE